MEICSNLNSKRVRRGSAIPYDIERGGGALKGPRSALQPKRRVAQSEDEKARANSPGENREFYIWPGENGDPTKVLFLFSSKKMIHPIFKEWGDHSN